MSTKISTFFNFIKQELNKAYRLMIKLVSASQSNSDLNNAYQELGKVIYFKHRSSALAGKSETVSHLIEEIANHRDELNSLHKEVEEIKKA